MKKVLAIVTSSALIVGGIYLLYQGVFLKRRAAVRAALSVNTPYTEVAVFVDDQFLGPTPLFKDDLKEGERTVRVGDWVGKVKLAAGTLTVINQDLGPSSEFSAGEVIWLEKIEKGTMIAIISVPDEVEVRLNENKIGETPIVNSSVSAGEYSLTLTKENYVSRTIRLRIQEGYRLNANAQLMKKPIPSEIKTILSDVPQLELRDYSTEDTNFLADLGGWVAGIVFYLKNYELEKKDYYLLDHKGNFYNSGGDLIAIDQLPKVEGLTEGEKLIVGYLGLLTDKGLSEAARGALENLIQSKLPAAPKKVQVEILQTGTGWLRVRSGPSLGDSEIAKVNVGEKHEFLEEQGAWYKIKLPEGTEGWISSQYAKKVAE